jgi:hypothetical protein
VYNAPAKFKTQIDYLFIDGLKKHNGVNLTAWFAQKDNKEFVDYLKQHGGDAVKEALRSIMGTPDSSLAPPMHDQKATAPRVPSPQEIKLSQDLQNLYAFINILLRKNNYKQLKQLFSTPSYTGRNFSEEEFKKAKKNFQNINIALLVKEAAAYQDIYSLMKCAADAIQSFKIFYNRFASIVDPRVSSSDENEFQVSYIKKYIIFSLPFITKILYGWIKQLNDDDFNKLCATNNYQGLYYLYCFLDAADIDKRAVNFIIAKAEQLTTAKELENFLAANNYVALLWMVENGTAEEIAPILNRLSNRFFVDLHSFFANRIYDSDERNELLNIDLPLFFISALLTNSCKTNLPLELLAEEENSKKQKGDTKGEFPACTSSVKCLQEQGSMYFRHVEEKAAASLIFIRLLPTFIQYNPPPICHWLLHYYCTQTKLNRLHSLLEANRSRTMDLQEIPNMSVRQLVTCLNDQSTIFSLCQEDIQQHREQIRSIIQKNPSTFLFHAMHTAKVFDKQERLLNYLHNAFCALDQATPTETTLAKKDEKDCTVMPAANFNQVEPMEGLKHYLIIIIANTHIQIAKGNLRNALASCVERTKQVIKNFPSVQKLKFWQTDPAVIALSEIKYVGDNKNYLKQINDLASRNPTWNHAIRCHVDILKTMVAIGDISTNPQPVPAPSAAVQPLQPRTAPAALPAPPDHKQGTVAPVPVAPANTFPQARLDLKTEAPGRFFSLNNIYLCFLSGIPQSDSKQGAIDIPKRAKEIIVEYLDPFSDMDKCLRP